MNACSILFPTGVAGRDKEAWTAESVLSISDVGELGTDILSVLRSRTASSCRRSAGDWSVTNQILIQNATNSTNPILKRGFFLTSGFVFQPLHWHEERLLLVQLALKESISLDGLVQTALKVLQRHYCCPKIRNTVCFVNIAENLTV